MTEIRVYDWRGVLRPEGLEYLYSRYGHFVFVEPAPGPGPAYYVRALYERADGDFNPAELAKLRGTPAEQEWLQSLETRAAATFVARVVDSHGQPLQGVRVAFYWDKAPLDPDAGPAGGVLPGMVPGRADVGVTSDTGSVGWGMGGGAYFWPGHGEIGPHAVWVGGGDTRSALLLGAGMVAMTNHYHWDVELERRDGDPGEGGGMEYLDENGVKQDENWAQSLFGRQEFHRPEGFPVYRLTVLRATSGETRTLTVSVLDVDGGPLTGVPLVLYRRNVEHPEPRYATTGTDGCASFDMNGTVEHSAIDGQGQYAVGVPDARSDFYNAAGLVMLKKASPRWLSPTFQLQGEDPDVPDPEPPGPPIDPAPIDPALRDQVLARVAVIENQCAELWALLK